MNPTGCDFLLGRLDYRGSESSLSASNEVAGSPAPANMGRGFGGQSSSLLRHDAASRGGLAQTQHEAGARPALSWSGPHAAD